MNNIYYYIIYCVYTVIYNTVLMYIFIKQVQELSKEPSLFLTSGCSSRSDFYIIYYTVIQYIIYLYRLYTHLQEKETTLRPIYGLLPPCTPVRTAAAVRLLYIHVNSFLPPHSDHDRDASATRTPPRPPAAPCPPPSSAADGAPD